MKAHTDSYKTEIKKFGRQIDSKITYVSDGETVTLGPEQLNAITPHYESALLKSTMKQLDIDSNVEIPVGTEVNYQFGLKLRSGKNLLNVTGVIEKINGITFTRNSDGTITAKGTSTATATYVSTTMQEIKPNTLYRVSGSPTGGGSNTHRILLRVKDSSGTTLSTAIDVGNPTGTTYGVFTTESTAKYISGELQVASGQTVNFTFKPQVEEISEASSPATEYEQYGAYDYIDYGNYIVKEVEKQEDTRSWKITCYDKMLYAMKDYEKIVGKNLFDKDNNSQILNASLNASTGQLGANDSYRTFYMKCEPSTTYTVSKVLSARFCIAESSDEVATVPSVLTVLMTGNTQTSMVCTTSSSAKLLFVMYYSTANDTLTEQEVLDSIIVEKGSLSTAYVPFFKYPTTVKEYINALCYDIGLEFGSYIENFANQSRTIGQEFYLDSDGNSLGYTYRDVLDELAQVTGSTICINDKDELEVRYVNDTGTYETSEGTAFQIENVDETKNIELELKGNTYQKTTTGSQLFNIHGNYSGTTPVIINNGFKLVKGTNRVTRFHLPKECPAGTYTLSNDVVEYTLSGTGTIFAVNLQYGSSNTQIQTVSLDNNTSTTFTTTQAFDRMYFFINNNQADDATVVLDNVMLNSGSSALPWEPYTNGASPNPSYPQKVENVTGRQQIKLTGRNLFEDEYIPELGDINAHLKQGTYVISMVDKQLFTTLQFKLYDENGNLITGDTSHITFSGAGSSSYDSLSGLYTYSYPWPPRLYYSVFVLDGDYQVAIGLYNSDGTRKVMLNSGTTIMDYEPYKEKSYDIDLSGENLLDIKGIIKGRLDNGVIGYQSNVTSLTLGDDSFSFTTNANWRGVSTDFIEISGSMRISYENLNSEFSFNVVCYDENRNWIANGTLSGDNTQSYRSISVVSGTKYVRLYFYLANAGSVTIVNPMLVKGTTVKDYDRYRNIELCKIGDYQDFIKKGTGKNLLDVSKAVVGKLLGATTGQPASFSNNANWTTVMDYIPVEYGDTYTLSRFNVENGQFIFAQFDEKKNLLTRSNNTLNNQDSMSYTINKENAKYLMIGYREDYDHTNIMLEKNSSKTVYEPYGYKDKWYTYKEIGNVVLNGTETWSYSNSVFGYTYSLQKYVGSTITSMSNYFKGGYNKQTTSNYYNNNNNNTVGFSKNALYIRCDDITDETSFKTWLSNHNVSVYYVLATPTATEIINEDLINQLNSITMLEGCNNITITSSDMSTPLEVTYLSQLDTIDEEYLKDVNVNFGEKYGPINSIVLSRASESDNVYLQDESSVEENGLCELKIIDNQIMSLNDRSDYLPELLERLGGTQYYLNDFSSTGITYYELLDKYKIKVGNNYYKCIMFNDEIDVTQGLEEQVHTDMPEETQTDYTKADKTDRRIRQAYIIVDKQNSTINSVVKSIGTLQSAVEGQGKQIEDIGTTVTQTLSNITASVTTIQNELNDGVGLVKTTTVTIDDTGLNVSTDTSKTTTTMTSDKFSINSSGTELAFFGYDEETNSTKAEMDNVTVTNYFVAGYHRTEKMPGENRTGVFYIGE